MTSRSTTRLVAALFLALASARRAAADWALELLTGSAHNFETPLRIRQSGFPELELDGRYDTRPFEGSPYLAARVGYWRGSHAAEVQLLHHKLYLSYATPEVPRFEVTHGYNLLTFGYARLVRGWVLRAGAGIVVAHPESTVRRRTIVGFGPPRGLGQGVAGPTAELTVGRRWTPGRRRWLLSGEVKLTRSWAVVPVADGEADTPNLALHGLLGVGLRF
jgi:hypothetical protein